MLEQQLDFFEEPKDDFENKLICPVGKSFVSFKTHSGKEKIGKVVGSMKIRGDNFFRWKGVFPFNFIHVENAQEDELIDYATYPSQFIHLPVFDEEKTYNFLHVLVKGEANKYIIQDDPRVCEYIDVQDLEFNGYYHWTIKNLYNSLIWEGLCEVLETRIIDSDEEMAYLLSQKYKGDFYSKNGVSFYGDMFARIKDIDPRIPEESRIFWLPRSWLFPADQYQIDFYQDIYSRENYNIGCPIVEEDDLEEYDAQRAIAVNHINPLNCDEIDDELYFSSGYLTADEKVSLNSYLTYLDFWAYQDRSKSVQVLVEGLLQCRINENSIWFEHDIETIRYLINLQEDNHFIDWYNIITPFQNARWLEIISLEDQYFLRTYRTVPSNLCYVVTRSSIDWQLPLFRNPAIFPPLPDTDIYTLFRDFDYVR